MDENADALNLVLRAAEFAAHKHRTQRRKDTAASPYVNHPIALARMLSEEGGVHDPVVLAAALLHDTIEDTETSYRELRGEFGAEVADVVAEVTDTKWIGRSARKQIQVSRAAKSSHRAKLVKIADKIANLRDIISNPPADWTEERKRQYFDWAKSLIDRLRGTNEQLERRFYSLYRQCLIRQDGPDEPAAAGPHGPNGVYAPLVEYLMKQDPPEVSLSFDRIEQILQRRLPASGRRYPAFWSRGNHVGRQLFSAGWRASLPSDEGRVIFRRVGPAAGARPPAEPRSSREMSLPAPDIVLVGCVKSKRRGRRRVEDLYTSALFHGRAAYARSTGKPWYVLSAAHGLLAPGDVIEYYDVALKEVPVGERRDWSRRVVEQIDRRIGSVEGKVIEIHAGKAYRDYGLVDGLTKRGAVVTVPLADLRQGEQLAWYSRSPKPAAAAVRATGARYVSADAAAARPMPVHRVREIVRSLTEEFTAGKFNLSRRVGAPRSGWVGIPEVRMAEALRRQGISDRHLRIVLTLGVAMDRARDADRLWDAMLRLIERHAWTLDPATVATADRDTLGGALAESGVSQRHGPDTAAWQRIMQAMVRPEAPQAFRDVIDTGQGRYEELLEALSRVDSSGEPWFPLLRGPKISLVWIRMLVEPGGAEISGLNAMPIAVDAQVRKVTEYLGVTDTRGWPLARARSVIQAAWHSGADASVGPKRLAGTPAALDPAVWFLGKWGCTHCEAAGARSPVATVCSGCRYDSLSHVWVDT